MLHKSSQTFVMALLATSAVTTAKPDFLADLEDFGAGVGSLAQEAFGAATSIGYDAFTIATSVGHNAFTYATSVGHGAFTAATSYGADAFEVATSVGADAYEVGTSVGAKAWTEGTSLGQDGWEGATSLAVEGYEGATSVGARAGAAIHTGFNNLVADSEPTSTLALQTAMPATSTSDAILAAESGATKVAVVSRTLVALTVVALSASLLL